MDYSQIFRLDNKRALVIGAGSGIGRECALALSAQGAWVIAADRDLDSVEETCQNIANGQALQLDVTDADQVAALTDLAPLDIVLHTPAINVRKSILGYTLEEFDRVIALNLRATFDVLRTAGAMMTNRGSGSIILFSSIRAIASEPGQSIYGATKAGLESLVRTAAAEFGVHNVRVNAVRPGVVETPLTAQLRANEEWNSAYAEKSALGRWAKAEELAGAALYLASDASTFVTGSTITVDGGWTAIDGRYTPPLPA
jgi:NAD(P)-dependent dehydrogenase (short-subunit alcohol dehydrogenase family)